jgi:hypothetical protein
MEGGGQGLQQLLSSLGGGAGQTGAATSAAGTAGSSAAGSGMDLFGKAAGAAGTAAGAGLNIAQLIQQLTGGREDPRMKGGAGAAAQRVGPAPNPQMVRRQAANRQTSGIYSGGAATPESLKATMGEDYDTDFITRTLGGMRS